MSDGALLRAAYLPLAALERQSPAWQSGVFGGATFDPEGCALDTMAFPMATVRAPQLESLGTQVEIWRTGGVLTSGQHGAVAWRHDDGRLFGSAVVDEAELGPTHRTGTDLASPLHLATSRIYGDIFDGLELTCWCWISESNG